MPIDIERFEQDPEDSLRVGGPTNAEAVLSFLSANPDQAYTPREIHQATDIARGSVGVVLSRLEDRAFVRHRGEYWAIEPDVDAETTVSGMATARVASERLGAEDPDDWGAGVDGDQEDE